MNKKRFRLVVIFLVTLLLFSVNILVSDVKTAEGLATTNSYYVSTKGSDRTGDGSFNNPWGTIQKAVSMVSAGDNVYIRAGTYYEEIIIGNKNGNENQWITFMPYNNEDVIIDGRNVIPDYYHAIFYIHDSSYIRITGLRLLNSAYGGVHIQNKDTNHIRIDNNTISNCSARGIATFADGSTLENLIIEYNNVDFVLNNWKGIGGNAGEAISLGNVYYFDISFNHVSRSGKECIDLKDGCSYGTVHHNKIDTSSVPGGFNEDYNHIGLYIDPGSKKSQNIDVYNNLVYGDHGGGIWICPEGSGGSVENINVYNNIVNLTWDIGNGMGFFDNYYKNAVFKNVYFYSNTVYTIWLPFKITAKQALTSDIKVKNNIFTAKNNALTLYCSDINYFDNVIDMSNNLFHNYVGNIWCKWKDVESGTIGFGTNAILGDPKFVKISNPCDLSPDLDSPVIDNGTCELVSHNDFNDITRPQNGKYDIGAYEYYIHDDGLINDTLPINDKNITNSSNNSIPTTEDENNFEDNNTITLIDTNETNTTNNSIPPIDNTEEYSQDDNTIPLTDNNKTNTSNTTEIPTENQEVNSGFINNAPIDSDVDNEVSTATVTTNKDEEYSLDITNNLQIENDLTNEAKNYNQLKDDKFEQKSLDIKHYNETNKSQGDISNIFTHHAKAFNIININPLLYGITFYPAQFFKTRLKNYFYQYLSLIIQRIKRK